MSRSGACILGTAVLSVSVLAADASAAPIVTIYTSESALAATLPAGTSSVDVLVGSAEFGDPGPPVPPGTDLDFNLTYSLLSPSGTGSILQVFEDGSPSVVNPACDGHNSECIWSTTGPISFALDVGTANAFVMSYMTLGPNESSPVVHMTLADGSLFDVGPLVGGPFEAPGELFFAFTSTEPFKAVSLDLADGDPLNTQFAAFASYQPVPEPATLLLVATGALAVARVRPRGKRRAAPLDEKRARVTE